MDEDKAKVVPVMTTHERQEMLNLQEQGELPENIDRSTDLYFRFLLGTPARGRLLRDMLNAFFGALGYPLLQTVTLTDTEREPEALGAKYTRLDLTALDDLGRTLHIEMQRENYTHFSEALPLLPVPELHEVAQEGRGVREPVPDRLHLPVGIRPF